MCPFSRPLFRPVCAPVFYSPLIIPAFKQTLLCLTHWIIVCCYLDFLTFFSIVLFFSQDLDFFTSLIRFSVLTSLLVYGFSSHVFRSDALLFNFPVTESPFLIMARFTDRFSGFRPSVPLSDHAPVSTRFYFPGFDPPRSATLLTVNL